MKVISENRKASFNFFIDETYQAGIELFGTEVKSIRKGKCNIKDSFIRIENGEAFIIGMHVSPYEAGNIFNREPLRRRRLLLHKYEIEKLNRACVIKSYTIIPLRVYLDKSLIKLDIATAKGKKLYDKRDAMAKKDMERDVLSALKSKHL